MIRFLDQGFGLKKRKYCGFKGKVIGFADFENTVGRGSVVNFGSDSRLCLH